MSNDNTEPISAKLRRWAADGDTYESPSHCIASKELCTDCPNIPCLKCENKLFNRIADEIDREMDELRESFANPTFVSAEDAVREVALGKSNHGTLRLAIERWYNSKPIDNHDEPIDIGQPVDDKVRGELEVSRICYTKSGFYFNNSRGSNGRKMKGITYKYGERVGRPKQPVLDADGVPVEVGDIGWLTHLVEPIKVIVEQVLPTGNIMGIRIGKANGLDEHFTTSAEHFTHREPDTQERIDEDAQKDAFDYWRCNGVSCRECPSMIDGKKPRHRYGVDWCSDAKTLDLLRRQRELDGRDA